MKFLKLLYGIIFQKARAIFRETAPAFSKVPGLFEGEKESLFAAGTGNTFHKLALEDQIQDDHRQHCQ